MSDQITIAIIVFLLLIGLVLTFLFLSVRALQRQRKEFAKKLKHDLSQLRLGDQGARLETFKQFAQKQTDVKFVLSSLERDFAQFNETLKSLEQELSSWAGVKMGECMKLLLFSRAQRHDQDLFVLHVSQKVATLKLELSEFASRVDEAVEIVLKVKSSRRTK